VQAQAADAARVLQAAARGKAARVRAAALREERDASEGFLRGAAVWSLDSGAATTATGATTAATAADSGSGSADSDTEPAVDTDATNEQVEEQADNDSVTAAAEAEKVVDEVQAVEVAEGDSPQTSLAATSIQSSFRGHMARRRAAKLTEKQAARAAAAEQRASAKAADAAAATIQGKVKATQANTCNAAYGVIIGCSQHS
jgi:IQ calmodulin-binding motif